MKSNTILGKSNKLNTIEGQEKIIQEAAMQDSDRELLTIIRSYLNDMLENTYNALINEVFKQISPNTGGEMGRAELDHYHFFKFSAFMINVHRMKSYEDH